MEIESLSVPEGLTASLVRNPRADAEARVNALAVQLISERARVLPKAVRVEYEIPGQFGHRVVLQASVDRGEPLPITITHVSHGDVSIVGIVDNPRKMGFDLRSATLTERDLADIRRHSHLFDTASEADFLRHWTRVQAVIAADARGSRVQPEFVRLEPVSNRGWVRDRRIAYDLVDLSRDDLVITLAHGRHVADIPKE